LSFLYRRPPLTRERRQAFAAMPVDDPTVNARVILLFLHAEHAWALLEHAAQTGFQPDSIFVSPGGWPGGVPSTALRNVLARKRVAIPGYLGLMPYKSPARENAAYLERLRAYELAYGLPVSAEISTYGADSRGRCLHFHTPYLYISCVISIRHTK
jgi:hypothetical protein